MPTPKVRRLLTKRPPRADAPRFIRIAPVAVLVLVAASLGLARASAQPAHPISPRVAFFDWEKGLVGREAVIAGHPGSQPPTRPLRAAKAEWKAAGRAPENPVLMRLVYSGAFPDRASAAAVARRRGARVMWEYATGRYGEPIHGVRGWYALAGTPALTDADIVRPVAERSEVGGPVVTFGFTDEGRIAFESLTRLLAQSGREAAVGRVSRSEAGQLSHHLAIVVGGQVMSRPIINFIENPEGIDGRTGAQISSFFRMSEARELVAALR